MTDRVVHKHAFPPGEAGLTLELPVSSTIAHFAEQRGALCVWIDRPVDDDTCPTTFDLVIRGTGDPIPASTGQSWRHHASTLVADGTFVFHLYGRTR